jgi:dUTPase
MAAIIVNNVVSIKIKQHSNPVPRKPSAYAAAYDLVSLAACVIQPHATIIVWFGVSLEMPVHFYARIDPRLKLSAAGVLVSSSVIDADCKKELCSVVTNTTGMPVNIAVGQRIAKLTFHEKPSVRVTFEDNA